MEEFWLQRKYQSNVSILIPGHSTSSNMKEEIVESLGIPLSYTVPILVIENYDGWVNDINGMGSVIH